MGGNALKTVTTVRKARAEYDDIKQKVMMILASATVCARVVRELPYKPDFGDLDVLICLNECNPKTFIETWFHPQEIVHNGKIYSFDFGGDFQIDFIICSVDTLPMFQFFNDYGDVSRILGYMTHAHNLKFGVDGLWIIVGNGHYQEKIVLNNVPESICEFIGLDYHSWRNGFTARDEIIRWIQSSRLYHPDIFAWMKKKDQIQRVAHRPFILEFLAAVSAPPVLAPPTVGTVLSPQRMVPQLMQITNTEKSNDIYQDAISRFNGQEKIDAAEERFRRRILLRQKFNGGIMIARQVPFNAIGRMIKAFQQEIEKTEQFDDWVIKTSEEEIGKRLDVFLKNSDLLISAIESNL